MKRIIPAILALFVSFSFLVVPAYADNCVDTAIIGDGQLCDDGRGSSIIEILVIVANVLGVGVGVLGVLGITVVGIQYLTAGGNEEQTRTAKRRIIEIVIGLAIYAIAYWILRWLLPGYNGLPEPSNTSNSSQQTTTNPQQTTTPGTVEKPANKQQDPSVITQDTQ